MFARTTVARICRSTFATTRSHAWRGNFGRIQAKSGIWQSRAPPSVGTLVPSFRLYATISTDQMLILCMEDLGRITKALCMRTLPPDDKMQLSIAHGLGCMLLRFLDHPRSDTTLMGLEVEEVGLEIHNPSFFALAGGPAPPHSNIARARLATVEIIKGIIHQTTSIPPTSPLRTDTANCFLFLLVNDMRAIGDAHTCGVDGKVESWTEYWEAAHPFLLALVRELGRRKFVLRDEDGISPFDPGFVRVPT